jgi:hypothetical protein
VSPKAMEAMFQLIGVLHCAPGSEIHWRSRRFLISPKFGLQIKAGQRGAHIPIKIVYVARSAFPPKIKVVTVITALAILLVYTCRNWTRRGTCSPTVKDGANP